MLERYLKNLSILSPEEQAALAEKRVCIVGCGGLGGYAAEFLARLGVGFLRVVDGDCFEVSNLNRQLFSQEALIGTSKASAAKERLSQINSRVKVEAVEEFLRGENALSLLGGCHLAIDALDSVPARKLLASACGQAGIPLIHGAVEGWQAQVAVLLPGSGLFDLLYPEGNEFKAAGTASFVPAFAASVEAAEAVKLLLGRESTLAGRLLTADLFHGDIQTIDLG